MSLDRLSVGTKARVSSIEWAALDDGDPIAIRVGRMTVAIRRRHAGAISVLPIR
nr:ferrous iron transport protein A [Sphingomonas sp.]